jgi:ferredoxin-NADP reductase
MKLTLLEKRVEAPGVESFIFKSEEPLRWQPGQYLHYVLHHRPTDDRGSDRWFTVASAPFEEHPMITTRLASEKGSTFKQALASLAVGEQIEVSAVEGDFTVTDPSQKYVFIAGGIGITPFHSILKQADRDMVHLDVQLLYTNRDEHVPFKTELDSFASRNANLKIQYITAPQRIDEQLVRQMVPDLHAPIFYISGPEPMVKSLAATLEAMGVAPDHIKLDDFPGYPAD